MAESLLGTHRNDTAPFIEYMISHDLTCLVSFVPSFLATGTRLCALILLEIGKDPSNVVIFQSVPAVVIIALYYTQGLDKVTCMMESL